MKKELKDKHYNKDGKGFNVRVIRLSDGKVMGKDLKINFFYDCFKIWDDDGNFLGNDKHFSVEILKSQSDKVLVRSMNG